MSADYHHLLREAKAAAAGSSEKAASEKPSPEKALLRARIREDLALVSAEELRRASDRVREHLLALPLLAKARRVLACLSFGREIDTWGVIDVLAERSVDVFVPRADRGDPLLHVHSYPCRLRRLRWGLQQPFPGDPELPDREVLELDAALIPGLAFDPSSGRRLGYGGGYFDRFLARTGIPGIGLALERQVRSDVPGEPHDVPMRWIVTEEVCRGPSGPGPSGPPGVARKES